jgi:hypothetical protein
LRDVTLKIGKVVKLHEIPSIPALTAIKGGGRSNSPNTRPASQYSGMTPAIVPPISDYSAIRILGFLPSLSSCPNTKGVGQHLESFSKIKGWVRTQMDRRGRSGSSLDLRMIYV